MSILVFPLLPLLQEGGERRALSFSAATLGESLLREINDGAVSVNQIFTNFRHWVLPGSENAAGGGLP
jgi:hypothetical protein